MAFADSNRASIHYLAELTTSWGVTPAGGSTRQLRFNSSSMAASKDTVVSDELRADRMVSSVVEVGATTGGDVNFEFSAGSQDDFMQAFLLGAWTRPMTFDFWKGTQVSIGSTSTILVTGLDVSTASGYLVAGRHIKTEGFWNDGNNGYWEISTATFGAGVTTITITVSTLTIEVGSAYTKVSDANDVIILEDNTVGFGAAAAAEIDGTFTTAVAAGQLIVGQRIYTDVLKSVVVFDNATITWSGVGQAGDQITLFDGTNTLVLEADGGGLYDYLTLGTAALTSVSFRDAVGRAYAAGAIDMDATDGTLGVINMFIISNDAASTIVDTVDGLTQIAVSATTSATFPAIRGFYTLTSVTNTVLGVSPAPPTVAAGQIVTIKSSMLKNPGVVADITPQSFTMETGFTDVGLFFEMDGLRVGTFSLDVSSGAIVTGTMGFQGRETTTAVAARLAAAPYLILDTTATEVMNATTNVGAIQKDGVDLVSAIQAVTLEGDASLRDQMAVGFKFPKGIGTGRFNLTGTLTAYFETLLLYNNFINHDTVALAFDFTDLDGNVYWFTVPALKITSDPVVPSGIDEDVVEEMEWTAFRDSTTATMFQIDRFSSNKAH